MRLLVTHFSESEICSIIVSRFRLNELTLHRLYDEYTLMNKL